MTSKYKEDENFVVEDIFGLNKRNYNTTLTSSTFVSLAESLSLSLENDICENPEQRTVSVAELVACIVAVLTVIENFVILLAIIRGHRSLRTPPYWFIASLACADLMTGIEVVLAVFVPIGISPNSRILLKGLAVVTFIASVNSLFLVALDRYFRIVRFAEYKKILQRRSIILLIILSWIISFVIFLFAPLLGWSCADVHCCALDGMCVCRRSKFGDNVCGNKCSQSFIPFTKSYIITGLVYFTVCVVAMAVLYYAIFKTVREKSFGGVDLKSRQKREVKLAKTLAITLGIFVICWLPVQALFVADSITLERSSQLTKMFDYTLVPSVINSFMNPIIYSIRLPRMRDTIERMLLPCCYTKGSNGSIWKSSTSGEKSFRKSIRRLSNKTQSPMNKRKEYNRSRIFSNKSLNSELSTSHSKSLVHDK